jgi:hypothetical protein
MKYVKAPELSRLGWRCAVENWGDYLGSIATNLPELPNLLMNRNRQSGVFQSKPDRAR